MASLKTLNFDLKVVFNAERRLVTALCLWWFAGLNTQQDLSRWAMALRKAEQSGIPCNRKERRQEISDLLGMKYLADQLGREWYNRRKKRANRRSEISQVGEPDE